MKEVISEKKQIAYILLALFAIFFLPYFGAWLKFSGHFPADYFLYPNTQDQAKAEFSPVIFGVISVLFVIMFCLYAFPKIFGFKQTKEKPKAKTKKTTPLPFWFWIGLVIWGVTLFFRWGKFSSPNIIIHWAAIPLFWGFSMVIDGWVFKRTGGKSLFNNYPREMIAIGIASISGWLIFEYLDCFILNNWVYPFAHETSEQEFLIYATLGSSGLFPLAFQWFTLLHNFKGMRNRFSKGIKITLSPTIQNIILVVCLVSSFLAPFYPNQLFVMIWIGPLIILSITLSKAKIWSPFTEIKSGNWTFVLLFGLAYLIQGVLCECWNYFTAYHGEDFFSYAPDYWIYSIPYVNDYHLFEMPILGYLGYIPFGVFAAIWWLVFAFLVNRPAQMKTLLEI
ncbi:MAG: hypothetical protein JJU02_05965 [Cryomorphaceae bacterium]|nr:hypothetical protein [Cryomorphaceae bacterium]